LLDHAHPSEDSEALPETLRESISPIHPSRQHARLDPGLFPNWYAVYTASRHEKKVARHLNQREVDCFLPLYHSQRRWKDGSKVTLELPLFPGYLFVRMTRSERLLVLQAPGVIEIVGSRGGILTPLPSPEIEALRGGAAQLQAEPHPLLVAGCRARIRAGALAGLEGIVIRLNNSMRVVLTLKLIQQSIAVEVGVDAIELLDSMES
jgi:transcription antitermination factor NusG